MIYSKETVANITPEEFMKLYENFNKDIGVEHQKLLKLEVENKLNNYNDSKFFVSFFETISIESADIDCEDLESTLEILNNFKDTCAEYKDKKSFCVIQENLVYDNYLDKLYYKASWEIVRDTISENYINTAFKSFVKEWLKPEGSNEYTRAIDCKMLSLFKGGHIDWNTLRTLTYTDCEV